jgi:hypothetical protein
MLQCAEGETPGTTTDAGEGVGGRPEPTADLLRQLDDDPLRAADVAEPIAVSVALHLANELRVAGSQAGDDGVDVYRQSEAPALWAFTDTGRYQPPWPNELRCRVHAKGGPIRNQRTRLHKDFVKRLDTIVPA